MTQTRHGRPAILTITERVNNMQICLIRYVYMTLMMYIYQSHRRWQFDCSFIAVFWRVSHRRRCSPRFFK